MPSSTPQVNITQLPNVPAGPGTAPVNSQGLTVEQMSAAAGARTFNQPTPIPPTPAPPRPVATPSAGPSSAMPTVAPSGPSAPPAAPPGQTAVYNATTGAYDFARNEGGLQTLQPGQQLPQRPVTPYSMVPGAYEQLPAGASQYDRQIFDVMKMNNISRAEAEARFANATAAQSGKMPVAPPTEGLTYDPSVNAYRDPLTRNFYAGVDPSLGNIFTPEQRAQVTEMAQMPGGIVTTDGYRAGVSALEAGLQKATLTPLPSSGSTTGSGAGVSSDPLMASLPAELQPLQDELDRAREYMSNPEKDPSFQLLQQMRADFEAQRANQLGDIHASANAQRDAQKEANKQALARVTVQMANLGISGSTQDMQFTADTIRQGEKTLNAIADSERKAINDANAAFNDRNFSLAAKQLEMSENRRKEYVDMAQNLFTLKQNYAEQLENRAIRRRELADKDLKFIVDSGTQYADLSPEKRAELTSMLGVSEEALADYLGMTAAQAEMKLAKDRAEVNKIWEETEFKRLDMALKMDESQEFQMMTPDGETYTIKGMKPANEDWSTSIESIGNKRMLVTYDKSGNLIKKIPVGDTHVAPYFNELTGQWVSYDPSNNTETTIMEPGQYGEGVAGLGTAANYVEQLTSKGFKVTQEPGGGYTHQNLTGWDVAMPSGTQVKSPTSNGMVIRVGNDPEGYGNFVDVQDVDTGAVFRMGHFSKIGVKEGSMIGGDAVLGLSGSTGKSTGPHLHVEVRTADNKAVTPGRRAPENSAPVVSDDTGDVIEQYNAAHPGANLGRTAKALQLATDWFDKQPQNKPKEIAKLPATQATNLSDGLSLGNVLGPVNEIVMNQTQLFGPVEGRKRELNPYDVEGQRALAKLSLAAQQVGKFMEGGVLRKEDEVKYKNMLPTLHDLPEVAQEKLVNVRAMLAQKYAQYISDYSKAGYDVRDFSKVTISSPDGSVRIEYDVTDPDQLSEYRQALEAGYIL